MIDLPCLGFGITVVDPGPKPKKTKRGFSVWFASRTKTRLLRASVTEIARGLRRSIVGNVHDAQLGEADYQIYWTCGVRSGSVWFSEEATTWIRGHGPQAHAALLTARALR